MIRKSGNRFSEKIMLNQGDALEAGHKGGVTEHAACARSASVRCRGSVWARVIPHPSFIHHRTIRCRNGAIDGPIGYPNERMTTMARYAIDTKTVSEAVSGGGLLVVAQWEAKDGEADRVADILSRFLPEAQKEPGVQLFLISRANDDPAQFLFYELFRDEAAFKEHQESEHFKTYIAGQALPLLARRERMQYGLI
jgi:quinol monooxygenase YgiN